MKHLVICIALLTVGACCFAQQKKVASHKATSGTLYFKDGMLIRKASFMMILIGFFQLGVIFTKIRLFSIVSLPKIL